MTKFGFAFGKNVRHTTEPPPFSTPPGAPHPSLEFCGLHVTTGQGIYLDSGFHDPSYCSRTAVRWLAVPMGFSPSVVGLECQTPVDPNQWMGIYPLGCWGAGNLLFRLYTQMVALIRRMLERDVVRRITLNEIKHNPWLTGKVVPERYVLAPAAAAGGRETGQQVGVRSGTATKGLLRSGRQEGGVKVCNFPQFRNFLQFSAIYRNFLQFSCNFSVLPILCACWCPLLSMVNQTSVQTMQNDETPFCPRLKMTEWFLPVPHGYAAMCV